MPLSLALALAAACGFIALSYEVLWYRAYAFVSGGSPATFGLLLGFYLLGIAGGSLGVRAYCAKARYAEDRSAFRMLAKLVFAANVAGYLVVPALASLATISWPSSFAVVVVAAGLLGAVFPLIIHHGVALDDQVGAKVSYVYLANVIGSAGGSLVTGLVLMERLSAPAISAVLLLLGALVSLGLLRVAGGALRGGLAGAVLTGSLLASTPLLFHDLYERLLLKKGYTGSAPFAAVVENRHGVIAVTAGGTVYGGGIYDGVFNTSLNDDRNGIERALAVGVLRPGAKRILLVGLSSGSWAQILANLPGVERVTVVEINPGYLQLIRGAPSVRSLLDNPKVEVVIDDGRRWLLRHPEEKFDAVVMNTTFHWRAHLTNLVSREFLLLARSHLNAGGLLHYNTTGSIDVQYTAAHEFQFALRVLNFMAVSDAPLSFDEALWDKLLREVRVDGRPLLDLEERGGPAALLRLRSLAHTFNSNASQFGLESRESVLARTARAGARIISDDNMLPEWRILHFQPEG